MEWQSDEFEKRSEIPTDFISNVSSIQLPTEMATGLFRIFQESLTNVSRHSQATHIEARLHVRDRNLTLQIRDNGRGFEISEIGHKKTLGLLGMKERTLLMRGTYNISSKPGEGTLVEISVPLPQSDTI
jgi:signal transduction histidine kinase